MLRTMVVVTVLLLAPSLAVADEGADVTKAFAAFIDGVAKGQAGSTAGVDVFIAPARGEPNGDFIFPPMPSDLAETRALIASSKLKVSKVVVSKSAKSAWIAGEVAGTVMRKEKPKKEPLRVSAFLFKDDKGWHVQATHWSTGEPDKKTSMCGSLEEWNVEPRIAPGAADAVKSVYAALEGDPMMEGGVKTEAFGKVLSADKNAFVIGSAPKETFAGGAKIKGIFKKWKISSTIPEDEKYLARASVGPDGEMLWIAMGVTAPPQLCATYRTFFVLAKEGGAWRIVHHHYSQPLNPF